jgi:DNA-binding transcriptional regulator YiaG
MSSIVSLAMLAVVSEEVTFMESSTLMGSGYYARIIRDLRETALTTTELAEIAGVKDRQVQHWAAGTHRPTGPKRDRLLEVAYIVDQLKGVYKPEGVDIWLHGRNRDLNGNRPIDLLREGDFAAVLNAVERLTTGAM